MSTVPDVPSPDSYLVPLFRPTRFGAWFNRTPWAQFAWLGLLMACLAWREYTDVWPGWPLLGCLFLFGVMAYVGMWRRIEWVPDDVARAEASAAVYAALPSRGGGR